MTESEHRKTRFVRVRNDDGQELYINPDKIVSIEDDVDDASHSWIVTESRKYFVPGNAKELAAKLTAR